MARRRGRTKRHGHTVSVSILVPRSIADKAPTVLDAPATFQRQRRTRHITVPLRRTHEPLVRKRYTVRQHPRDRENLPRNAYMSITRQGKLRIYSAKRTAQYLSTEKRRPRREERKTRKRRVHHGHLDSLRSDPTGIVLANLRASAPKIADAALVARAVRRYL
jgi:hypothetical protein